MILGFEDSRSGTFPGLSHPLLRPNHPQKIRRLSMPLTYLPRLLHYYKSGQR